ncbi:MAG: zf-HC2 domain-containing protein [Desulfomonilaceae bacterium]
MSECERVSDLFGEFHERRLDKQTETLVAKHLDGCPYCKNDYQWYGFTVQTLMNLEKVNPPECLLQQIKAKLHETNQPESVLHFFKNLFTASPYMPLPVGIGALILIVFVGVVIYDRSPHEVFSESAQSVARSETPTPAAPLPTHSLGSPWYQARSASPWRADGALAKGFFGEQPLLGGHLQQYAMSSPRLLEPDRMRGGVGQAPFARKIAPGNLTVQSNIIPVAVDSVKRMLPSLEGNLLEEKTEDRIGEIILGVAIPSYAYPKLTSELGNFGSLIGGLDPAASSVVSASPDGKKLVLYIRFTPSH